MLFSSVPFLYHCFLPLTLIVYYVAPRCVKNTVLLLASLVFYGWGGPVYTLLMLATIAVGYVSGVLIEHFQGTRRAKTVLWSAIAVFLGLLGYFKYADFFIDSVNSVTGLSIPLLHVVLPIGISFYTFQVLSYTVDVYRGDVKAQKNPINLAMYISMFPQLIAGPIVRYSDIKNEIDHRTHSIDGIALGIRRFVLGLAKKILIANAFGELCAVFRDSDDLSVLFYWIYAIAFMMQIYFDFSGYSDMAIGLGHLFGFRFPENFNYPYISKSVTEFWRRWHMSLGTWFRDYVYIPMGGNRVSPLRWVFNILTVWMLTGLWHGAAWNFVLWGLLFAILLMVEKWGLSKALSKVPFLSHVYVLFVVLISFVLFNATDLSGAVTDITSLFGAGNLPLISAEALYYLRSYAVLFIVAIIGSTPLPTTLLKAIRRSAVADRILAVTEPLVLTVLLLVMTAYLVDGSFNPFLYFRF